MKDGLPPLPARLAHLPLSESGFPAPWFVAWRDGVPDFRCMDNQKFKMAVEQDRCWTCGEINGVHKVFAIGPMCAVNKVTAEPPSHLECAEYSVKACPFLNDPKRRRRENDMPEDGLVVGEMIKRNPGVTLLWSTRKFNPFRIDGGVMFQLGEPTALSWWCRGRTATRAEVDASIESGIPLLRASAATDGPDAVAELESMYRAAQKYLPAAAAAP